MANHIHNPISNETGPFDLAFDQGLANRLTLVLGPDPEERIQALETWLDRRDYDALYIKCPTTSDQLRCSAHLVEAFKQAGIIDTEETEPDEDCQSRVVRLINHLSALHRDLVVILFDYEPSETTDRALSFLLDHLPNQIHLFITSEEMPGLGCIPRLRVRRQFQMIDTAAL